MFIVLRIRDECRNDQYTLDPTGPKKGSQRMSFLGLNLQGLSILCNLYMVFSGFLHDIDMHSNVRSSYPFFQKKLFFPPPLPPKKINSKSSKITVGYVLVPIGVIFCI